MLRALEGEITWVTSSAAVPLLQDSPYINTLLAFDRPEFRLEGRFDLVVNLEDDLPLARLAASMGAGNIIGPYACGNTLKYDSSCSEWFDMSLSSRYGRARADELKMQNRKSYQEMIFSAFGLSFQGQEPVLNLPLRNQLRSGLIGIEARAGGVWPSKCWGRYDDLADRLQVWGYQVTFFRQRESILDYADDINECEVIICGDTLAMHLGLALRRKVVALFTCTSPYEIYDYGRLAKVVSPVLEKHFYRRDYSAEATNAISIAAVEDALHTLVSCGGHLPMEIQDDRINVAG